jgi:hypothetical protein
MESIRLSSMPYPCWYAMEVALLCNRLTIDHQLFCEQENDEAENDIANNVDGGQVKFGGGVYDDRKNSENMGPTKSEQLSNEKRSSFVKAAPIQSEVRVSLPSQVMSLMSVKSGYKSGIHT